MSGQQGGSLPVDRQPGLGLDRGGRVEPGAAGHAHQGGLLDLEHTHTHVNNSLFISPHGAPHVLNNTYEMVRYFLSTEHFTILIVVSIKYLSIYINNYYY